MSGVPLGEPADRVAADDGRLPEAALPRALFVGEVSEPGESSRRDRADPRHALLQEGRPVGGDVAVSAEVRRSEHVSRQVEQRGVGGGRHDVERPADDQVVGVDDDGHALEDLAQT